MDLSKQCAKNNVKFMAKRCKCLGEYRCLNTECDYFRTLDKTYVAKVKHKNETETPRCDKCQHTLTKIACGAVQTLVRMTLPCDEGLLVVYKHEGTHSCTDLPKKGKGVLFDGQTKLAVRAAEETVTGKKPEKAKLAVGVAALRHFLTGNCTKEEMLSTVQQVCLRLS